LIIAENLHAEIAITPNDEQVAVLACREAFHRPRRCTVVAPSDASGYARSLRQPAG
jgi:hypothetical protein